jgi:hypothetical protein
MPRSRNGYPRPEGKALKKVIYSSFKDKGEKERIERMDDFHKKLVESTVRYQNDRIDAPTGEFIRSDSGRRLERAEKVIFEKRASRARKSLTAVEL